MFVVFCIISILITLNSCTESNNEEIKPEEPLVIDFKKALTGTFVDFWDKNNWTQQDWESVANNKQMAVYIGLYFNDEYWENQNNVDWLRLHASMVFLETIKNNCSQIL